MSEASLDSINRDRTSSVTPRKRKFSNFDSGGLLDELTHLESFPPALLDQMQTKTTEPSPDCPILHIVKCGRRLGHETHYPTAYYRDRPRLFAGDTHASALRGHHIVDNVQQYLDRHEELCIVIHRSYSCEDYHRSVSSLFERFKLPRLNHLITPHVRPYLFVIEDDAPEASCESEKMIVVSESIKQVLTKYDALEDHQSGEYIIQAPYLNVYHHRDELKDRLKNTESNEQQRHLQAVMKYIDDAFGQQYEEADALFSRGLVSQQHFTKLFSLNDVVVTKEGPHPRAYSTTRVLASNELRVELECCSWDFDGFFRRSHINLEVEWPEVAVGELEIQDLSAYPLKFDNHGMEDRLRHRGELFWTFRARTCVSYDAKEPSFEIRTTNPRFMIDVPAYHDLHSNKRDTLQQDDIDPEELEGDKMPDDTFALLLPPTIQGFGFHDKKWKNLSVEMIREVSWNETAFEKLVLEERKKELVKALINIHTATFSSSTDIIEGKGNGLIMLFHGGPGTGKTLTAESVAELTKKPLYRVTCGDMGTDPEKVENYLESVLYIGTTWKCVVLLDEADVFLEERRDTDLQRNALVSVFLRILEYYDGILILTSNRVGIFDEAFKSRIQLSISYPALDEKGRKEVWSEFINSLQEERDFVDLEDINKKIGLLASNKLNGRQIRNTVKTARQLATYKKEKLRYRHFDLVIDVANEFEEYLTKTRGLDDDEKAEAEQVRGRISKDTGKTQHAAG